MFTSWSRHTKRDRRLHRHSSSLWLVVPSRHFFFCQLPTKLIDIGEILYLDSFQQPPNFLWFERTESDNGRYISISGSILNPLENLFGTSVKSLSTIGENFSSNLLFQIFSLVLFWLLFPSYCFEVIKSRTNKIEILLKFNIFIIATSI